MLLKRDFNKEKPKKEELILVKLKDEYFPYLAVYKIFSDGKEKIYLMDADRLVNLEDVERWWVGIPDDFFK